MKGDFFWTSKAYNTEHLDMYQFQYGMCWLCKFGIDWDSVNSWSYEAIHTISKLAESALRKNSKLAHSEQSLWLVELMAAYLQMWKEPVIAQSIK